MKSEEIIINTYVKDGVTYEEWQGKSDPQTSWVRKAEIQLNKEPLKAKLTKAISKAKTKKK